MGEIKAHEFVSLDGVYENPSWTFEFGFDPQMGERIATLTGPGTGILLGRRTYEMFYPAWSTRTAEDDPGAPFFNESPKYVVSGTLQEAPWNNSHIVGAYDPNRLRALKDEVEGDLYVSGSGTLVRGLLADGLLDELHLFVFPVALGEGEKLFGDGQPKATLALASTEAYGNGVVHLAYRAAL
jgi:dihydrofolate reductase